MPCSRTQHATPRQPRPVPETSRSKVAGRSHRATEPCIYMEYGHNRDTEGGLCQGASRPQWFFYAPLNVRGTAPPYIYKPREMHSLQCWITKLNLHKPLPPTGLEPGAVDVHDRRARHHGAIYIGPVAPCHLGLYPLLLQKILKTFKKKRRDFLSSRASAKSLNSDTRP